MQQHKQYKIKNTSTKMKLIIHIRKNKHFYQTIGSLNLGALCMGLAMGWPDPAFKYFYYDEIENVMVSSIDVSWVESVINAGASIGSIASIFINEIYGRRISFYLSAVIIVTFWLFLASSGIDQTLIISAAAVAGLGIGIFFATALLYVSEITSMRSRRIIGPVVFFSGYVGVFTIKLLENFFGITFIFRAIVIFPLLFFISIYLWMIESPFYLFQKGMILEAKIALKYLRGRSSVMSVYEEFKIMEGFFNSNFTKEPSQLLMELVCPKNLRLVTLIIIPILCVSQMLGEFAINDYAETFVETSYPSKGKLFTSFISIISTIFCFFMLEYFNKKPLLIFAIIWSGLCCLLFSVYSYFEESHCFANTMESDNMIIPQALLFFYYIVYALGLVPVLPIVTRAIFPDQIKTASMGIIVSLLYFVAFCVQRFYETLKNDINLCRAFASFTIFGSLGLPIAIVLLPERKDKSLAHVQNDLQNFLPV